MLGEIVPTPTLPASSTVKNSVLFVNIAAFCDLGELIETPVPS